jgi:hypothetical protein
LLDPSGITRRGIFDFRKQAHRLIELALLVCYLRKELIGFGKCRRRISRTGCRAALSLGLHGDELLKKASRLVQVLGTIGHLRLDK